LDLLSSDTCSKTQTHRLSTSTNLPTSSLDSIAQADANTNRYALAIVDICDGPSLGALFEKYQPQDVIHLAAESHVDRSIDGPNEFVQTNIVGTLTLLQEALLHWQKLNAAARDKFCFVHVSTDEVFGPSIQQNCSLKQVFTLQIRPTPRAKLRQTTWPAPSAAFTNCQPLSPIARTITALTIFRRN